MEKRIYLSSPHMGGEEMKYIKEAFDTNWVAPLGRNVEMYGEKAGGSAFERHCGHSPGTEIFRRKRRGYRLLLFLYVQRKL